MPIKIPDTLPALKVLESENVFVMTHERAMHQDIRPLRILLLNLMPTKINTETQLLRLLGNTPLQVEIDLLQTATHISRNTPAEHLLAFYKTFDEVRDSHYDGMIITGAPVEQMEFEDVDYWEELCGIMRWTKTHVFSTMHICWAAQAGLYYHYGVPKYPLERKLSGIFRHRATGLMHPLVRGFDEVFFAPHSRYTEVRREDIMKHPELQILAESSEAGVYLIATQDGRQIFATGHAEYDRTTLADEYFRDLGRGLEPDVPRHYFVGDDPQTVPVMSWRCHANLLYANWLNYFVYQQTPFDLSKLNSDSPEG